MSRAFPGCHDIFLFVRRAITHRTIGPITLSKKTMFATIITTTTITTSTINTTSQVLHMVKYLIFYYFCYVYAFD